MPMESSRVFTPCYFNIFKYCLNCTFMAKKARLQPLNSISMTDRVEGILRQYFEDNAFQPGDALPGEGEIAEKLEVSRNVVREALSRLRMLGIVESRTRRGMIMAKPDVLGGFERVLNPYILGDKTLKDIYEMRLILEMGMAEFFVARKTPKGVLDIGSASWWE